jgi:hypothetical protein
MLRVATTDPFVMSVSSLVLSDAMKPFSLVIGLFCRLAVLFFVYVHKHEPLLTQGRECRSCYKSGDATIKNATCAASNFSRFIGYDPVYKEAGLYLKNPDAFPSSLPPPPPLGPPPPAQPDCTTCQWPVHSWDHIPASVHTSRMDTAEDGR